MNQKIVETNNNMINFLKRKWRDYLIWKYLKNHKNDKEGRPIWASYGLVSSEPMIIGNTFHPTTDIKSKYATTMSNKDFLTFKTTQEQIDKSRVLINDVNSILYIKFLQFLQKVYLLNKLKKKLHH